jgi:hypothetical protein
MLRIPAHPSFVTLLSLAMLLVGCASAPRSRAEYGPGPYPTPSGSAPQLPPSPGVGAFGGLGLGRSIFHDYELDGLPGADVEEADTSFSAFAGYRWTPNYGVLLGYIDHGTLEASGPVGEGGQPFTDKIDYKSVVLCGMATAPIAEGTAVYGLLGAAHWNQDVAYREQSATPFNADSSGFSPAIGGGVNYFFDSGGHFGFNLTWIRIFQAGDKGKTDHDSDIDFVSLGFLISQ